MSDDELKSKLFYTVAEAAEALRVSVSTLYAAVREDAFPAVRIRGRYIVPARAIERLIESAIELDGSVDLKQLVAIRRAERDLARSH